MNTFANPKLTAFAKELRKNMIRHERQLWHDFLKTLPVTVRRQKVLGPYIVDFHIAEKKLVIELDSSQHFDLPGKYADAIRDSHLRQLGLTVLRYANSDIDLNFEGVCADILLHIQNS